jgi:hypothetical protein
LLAILPHLRTSQLGPVGNVDKFHIQNQITVVSHEFSEHYTVNSQILPMTWELFSCTLQRLIVLCARTGIPNIFDNALITCEWLRTSVCTLQKPAYIANRINLDKMFDREHETSQGLMWSSRHYPVRKLQIQTDFPRLLIAQSCIDRGIPVLTRDTRCGP